jgi:hypothetical protein
MNLIIQTIIMLYNNKMIIWNSKIKLIKWLKKQCNTSMNKYKLKTLIVCLNKF